MRKEIKRELCHITDIKGTKEMQRGISGVNINSDSVFRRGMIGM